MLSYQHAYHAGCFADVVKHLTLSRISHYLVQKDKPLFYLETHAGRGIYDLYDKMANKTQEYQQGIALLWQHRKKTPPVYAEYLKVITKYNPNGELRHYPGSPLFALELLRPIDRLVACELHPKEFDQLSLLPTQGKKIFYTPEDGMKNLLNLLPPFEKRGLIFIDPSYEIKDEYKTVPKAIKEAYKRFNNGTFCLWYPFIESHYHQQLLRGLETVTTSKTLRVEFYIHSNLHDGMSGCGLWIANPPYVLEQELISALDYLCTIINPGKSFYKIYKQD